MLSILLAASSLLAATAPAAADAAAPPSAVPSVAAKAASDPNAMICHKEVTPNSRVPTRVCVRAGDVHAQSDQDAKDAVSAAQSRTKAAVQSSVH